MSSNPPIYRKRKNNSQNSEDNNSSSEVISQDSVKLESPVKNDTIPEQSSVYLGVPYIIHEIECLCVSSVQRGMAHDGHGRIIEVFSLVSKDDGKIIPSIVQCEHCGRKWKVENINDYDLMTSDAIASYTKKRLQNLIPNEISHVCEELKVSTAIMAYIFWIFENKQWGSSVILSNKKFRREDEAFSSKILIINGPTNFSITEIKSSNIAEIW